MQKVDFNKEWICRCLTRDGPSMAVTLPHDAMRTESRTARSKGGNNIGWYLGGDYEYTKTFTAPVQWQGQTVQLEFEGVYHNAEVWINDQKAASRPYGYTNFFVDAGPFLQYGIQNYIRVVVHNSDQPNSRWYSGTGIIRPVWLYRADAAHIPADGLRVRTVSHVRPEVEVTVNTTQPGPVRVEVFDADDRLTAEAEGVSAGGKAVLRIPLPEGKLWDCNHPNLYHCTARFARDTAETTFGIRTLAWDAQHGLTLNGQRIILRGACIHHDNGLLGGCSYPEAEERRVRILKENGYNALRSAHNPCSKALLDACDRQGMLMMDEYVDVWYIHKNQYDYAGVMEKWWKQDLADMVDKDYNHPSVIMYCTGNEVAETAQPKGIDLTRQMTLWLHKLDGTRPVTCGINIFFNFLSSIGLGVYSDQKAEQSAAAAGKPSKKKPVGSEFYNTLACKVGDVFMKWGATLPPCDWKTRDAYANMDIAGYNYGLFRYRHDLKKYPRRLILGSETFCKDAYAFWEIAKQNPRIIGDFVWAGMDYIGETGEGAAEYSDYRGTAPETRMTGGNGRIDLLGKPRAEAAFTRVAFEQAVGPFLAVMPVYETEKLNLTGWQLTKAVESWSWRGCAGMPACVEVYARAIEVELLVNGTSVGRKKLRNTCRAVFHTSYADGTLTAVAYDAAGQEIGRRSLTTAGLETRLQVQPETPAVRPGGLCFVRLQYTDPDGIWKPMEKHTLTVRVTGGELMGLGSACPYVEGNYAQDTVKTYFGEAMAVLRAGDNGPLRLEVADEQDCIVTEIPVQ